VTVSFGVAEKTPALKTPDAVMKAADEALYQAKKQAEIKRSLSVNRVPKKTTIKLSKEKHD